MLCFSLIVNVFFNCSVYCYASSESESNDDSISDSIWDNVHRLANVVEYAASQLGTSLTFDYAKIVSNNIAWQRVKENGGLIEGLDGSITLSEETINQIKEAIKEATQDENGNDKYGMYLYESTSQLGFDDFLGVNAYYDPDRWAERDNLDLVLGLTDVWFIHSNQGSYCNSPPAGAVWVCPNPASTSVRFYHSGTLLSETSQYFRLRWGGSNWEWYEWAQESSSAGTTSSYFGKGHYCFQTLEGARQWKEDNNPYTLVPPTYTGGDLVIPKDQLVNPDNPDDSESPDDEDEPTTETGWLKKIYVRLGDILNQLKQIKWLTVGDVILNAIDTFGSELGDIVGAVADSVSMVFPLCIAWDFVHLLEIFVAEPVEPIFTIPFKYEPIGLDVTFTIDLTDWNWAVEMFRTFELLGFIVGLFNLTVAWVGKGDDV